jgi:hypothetical protein
MFHRNEELDKEDQNCPLCGRPLWECVTHVGEKRYCDSCNEEFEVKKVG